MTVFEAQWNLLSQMPHEVAEWGWQDEVCPETQKKHRQGYVRTKTQMRFSQMKKVLPGVHIEVAKDWNKLVQYCRKSDTSVEGTQVHEVSKLYNMYNYAEELGRRLYELYKHDYAEWSDNVALENIETHARMDIRAGHREIAWIISNPNWKCHWKFWRDVIASFEPKKPIEPVLTDNKCAQSDSAHI